MPLAEKKSARQHYVASAMFDGRDGILQILGFSPLPQNGSAIVVTE